MRRRPRHSFKIATLTSGIVCGGCGDEGLGPDLEAECRAAYADLVGTLEVVITPAPWYGTSPLWYSDWGAVMQVGDVLDLVAAVRPVIGASMTSPNGYCEVRHGAEVADDIVWSSSDEVVATVDQFGRVVAKWPSWVWITARATQAGIEGVIQFDIWQNGG